MKISHLISLVMLIFSFVLLSYSQICNIIPEDRVFEWKKAGYNKENVPIVKEIYVSNSGSLIDAVNNADTSKVTIIKIKKGTYNLNNNTLYLRKNIILRGTGSSPEETKLLFNVGKDNVCIAVYGQPMGPEIKVLSGLEFRSTHLTLEDASSINVGDYIEFMRIRIKKLI